MTKKKKLKSRYGSLIVIKISHTHITTGGQRKLYVLCECECGKIKTIRSDHLRNNKTVSCGCKKGELITKKKTKHGFSYTDIYHVWSSMKGRCYRKTTDSYKNYGARGINVCDEWLNDSARFIKWALKNGYKKGLEIDRINNDGNYSPDNCRFVTRIINSRNTRLLSAANTSGFRGVTKSGNRWLARVMIIGKSISLGYYDTPKEAAIARDSFVKEQNLGMPLNFNQGK